MALHEIGYLIIGGVFQCWFWSAPENPCPNSEKIRPTGFSRENLSEFEAREVHYEQSGYAVYEQKGRHLELKRKQGEKFSLDLLALNRQTQDALPKTVVENEIPQSLWRFEPLEEIIKEAMLYDEIDFRPLLRKEDLKTPLAISDKQLNGVKQARIDEILDESELSLPIGYIVTSVQCTYEKLSANSTAGSCAPPGKAMAYSKPDRNSEKVMEASLLWAHLEGRPIMKNEATPSEQNEELLVFEEKDGWFRMKLVVGKKSKRMVWFQRKDIPYKFVRLNENDRMKTLIEFLNPPSITTSDENRYAAEELKSLLEKPLKIDLDSAGETKWSEGILWIKVNVRNQPHCAIKESKTLLTGWLPYIDPKTKKKVINWSPRGC